MSSDPSSLIDRLHPSLQAAAAAMIQELHDEFWTIDLAEGGSPPRLSHFTSREGLRGILESGRIFASNALFLNDNTEGQYGRGLVSAVIEELAQGLRSAQLRETLTKFAHDWDKHPMLREEVYVASFCEDGDLPSQWPRYGQNGAGFSLALDASGAVPNERNAGMRLRRVFYEENQQKQLVRNTILRTEAAVLRFARFPGLSADDRGLFANEAALHLLTQLAEYPIFFKDSQWSVEREWRLARVWWSSDASRHLGEIRSRTSRGLLIPYVELDLGLSGSEPSTDLPTPRLSWPLKEIVFGPALRFDDLSVASVRRLLTSQGFDPDGIVFRASQAPSAVGKVL